MNYKSLTFLSIRLPWWRIGEARGMAPVVIPSRDTQTLVCAALRHAADTLGAPRALIAWEKPEEPWLYLALHVHGECSCTRVPLGTLEPLVAEALLETHFFCLDTCVRTPTVLYTSTSGLQRWQGSPLHPDLQARFAISRVLSLSLRGENLQGRLFVLDKPGMTSDDLILGELVARRVMADMNRVQLKLMAASKLSGLLEFLLGPVIVPRPIGPVNA